PAGDIPPLLAKLSLSELWVTYASKARAFSVSCGLATSAFGLPDGARARLVAEVEAPADPTGSGKATFSAEVTLNIPAGDGAVRTVELKGVVAKNADENTLVTLNGKCSPGLPLADLLKAMGLTDVPPTVLP